MFEFSVSTESRARAGLLKTGHGEVATPAFMPVGSQGTVKSISPRELKELGAEIVLANGYHLYLRPGVETVRSLGGLHGFMGWDGPILTDSGGYQVMSLAANAKVEEAGVEFRSHLDGSLHFISPERAVEIQEGFMVDVAMCLDICTSYDHSRKAVEHAMEITVGWAKRSLAARKSAQTALFAIIQGGVFHDLRERCIERLGGLDFDGFALGSLSTGEPKETLYEVMGEALDKMPEHRPRYVMGVGTPEDLVESVGLGADMFDCVLPTRNGRTGQLFTSSGKINIKNSRHKDDERPVEEGCGCYTCTSFSRAYLRHLFIAGELLAYRLATLHNLYYYINLMARIREAAAKGSFDSFKKEFYRKRNPNEKE